MEFNMTEAKVRTSGRILMQGETGYLGYSGSELSFHYQGKKAEAYLSTDGATYQECDLCWLAVFINDEEEPRQRFLLSEPEKWYTLYESEKEEDVTLHLVKMAEASSAIAGVKSLRVDGELLEFTQEESKRTMEFIGDSITCGFGNEGVLGDDYTTAQENPTKAYAMLTAKKLHAKYHLVSHSGIGLISRYTELDVPDESLLMPELYQYTNLCTNRKIMPDQLEMWDFSKYQPECIVINLGTNDSSYTKGIKERIDSFKKTYLEFLRYVHKNNKNAVIFCTLGAMGNDLYPAVAECAADLLAECPEVKIHSVELDNILASDGYATYSHPNLITHRKLANQLSEEIAKVMDWR